MGTMRQIQCKNCGYNVRAFFGEGMVSSAENHNNQDKYIKNAKKGEYGEDIKKIVNENADVYIAQAPAIAICSECGAIEHTEDFMVYVNHHYEKHEKHFKKCKKCGGDAEIFDECSINDAICPKCHEKIDVHFAGLWD